MESVLSTGPTRPVFSRFSRKTLLAATAVELFLVQLCSLLIQESRAWLHFLYHLKSNQYENFCRSLCVMLGWKIEASV